MMLWGALSVPSALAARQNLQEVRHMPMMQKVSLSHTGTGRIRKLMPMML